MPFIYFMSVELRLRYSYLIIILIVKCHITTKGPNRCSGGRLLSPESSLQKLRNGSSQAF